jgi:hypothetical protein
MKLTGSFRFEFFFFCQICSLRFENNVLPIKCSLRLEKNFLTVLGFRFAHKITFLLSNVFTSIWKQFSSYRMCSLCLENNFLTVGCVRFSLKTIFLLSNVFTLLRQYFSCYRMCSLRFDNNFLTIERVHFASISKKTPLLKLASAFISLSLPLLALRCFFGIFCHFVFRKLEPTKIAWFCILKGIDRPFGGGGVESILIRSLLVNWRLGYSFYLFLKGLLHKISKKPLDPT